MNNMHQDQSEDQTKWICLENDDGAKCPEKDGLVKVIMISWQRFYPLKLKEEGAMGRIE